MKYLIVFSLTAILFSGCDTGKEISKTPILGKLEVAKQLYENAEYEKSLKSYQKYIKDNSHKQKISQLQEAKLGIIITKLLLGKASFETDLKDWNVKNIGYWDGKTFMLFDGINASQKKAFQKVLSKKDFPFSSFLLLHFLIQNKHYSHIVSFVQKKVKEPFHFFAWKYCLAKAWTLLRKQRVEKARNLFLIIDKVNTSKNLKSNILYGKMLANFFMNGTVDFQFSRWGYHLEDKTFDFFRSSSPVYSYKSIKEKQKPHTSLVIADMVFQFGKKAKNKIAIWKKGLQFLQVRDIDKKLENITTCLTSRFEMAIAWSSFITGDIDFARKFFQKCKDDPSIKKNWKLEASIGLALISWQEDTSLEDMLDCFDTTPKASYWLGGKKIHFYRVPSRIKNKKNIEKICKDKDHRIYLTLIDVLCILGDGRAAQSLLGELVTRYQKKHIKNIYLEEQQYIPKDVYTENQIWEKLD